MTFTAKRDGLDDILFYWFPVVSRALHNVLT